MIKHIDYFANSEKWNVKSYDAFVSFNHLDSENKRLDFVLSALKEFKDLGKGIDICCSDDGEVYGGLDDLADAQVNACTVFVILMSKNALRSEWCFREFSSAVNSKKIGINNIVLVCFDDIFSFSKEEMGKWNPGFYKNDPQYNDLVKAYETLRKITTIFALSGNDLEEKKKEPLGRVVFETLINADMTRLLSVKEGFDIKKFFEAEDVQIKGDLSSLYLDRILKGEDEKAVNEDEFIDSFLFKKENALIVAEAGTGKTELLKDLCNRVSLFPSTRGLFFSCVKFMDSGLSFFEYALNSLKDKLSYHYDEDRLNELFKTKNIVIFLDGYDEIISSSRRNEFRKAIESFLNKEGYQNVRLVISSRYPSNNLINAFKMSKYLLQGFTNDDVSRYVHELFFRIETGKNDDYSYFYARLEEVEEEIRGNPLFLTQLTFIYKISAEVLTNKIDILEKVALYIGEIDRNNPVKGQENYVSPTKVNDLLRILAYEGNYGSHKDPFILVKEYLLRNYAILHPNIDKSSYPLISSLMEEEARRILDYLNDRSIFVKGALTLPLFNDFYSAKYLLGKTLSLSGDLDEEAPLTLREIGKEHNDHYELVSMFLFFLDKVLPGKESFDLALYNLMEGLEDFDVILESSSYFRHPKRHVYAIFARILIKQTFEGRFGYYEDAFYYVSKYRLHHEILFEGAKLLKEHGIKLAAWIRDILVILFDYLNVYEIIDDEETIAAYQKLVKEAKKTYRNALNAIFYFGECDYLREVGDGEGIAPYFFNAKALLEGRTSERLKTEYHHGFGFKDEYGLFNGELNKRKDYRGLIYIDTYELLKSYEDIEGHYSSLGITLSSTRRIVAFVMVSAKELGLEASGEEESEAISMAAKGRLDDYFADTDLGKKERILFALLDKSIYKKNISLYLYNPSGSTVLDRLPLRLSFAIGKENKGFSFFLEHDSHCLDGLDVEHMNMVYGGIGSIDFHFSVSGFAKSRCLDLSLPFEPKKSNYLTLGEKDGVRLIDKGRTSSDRIYDFLFKYSRCPALDLQLAREYIASRKMFGDEENTGLAEFHHFLGFLSPLDIIRYDESTYFIYQRTDSSFYAVPKVICFHEKDFRFPASFLYKGKRIPVEFQKDDWLYYQNYGSDTIDSLTFPLMDNRMVFIPSTPVGDYAKVKRIIVEEGNEVVCFFFGAGFIKGASLYLPSSIKRIVNTDKSVSPNDNKEKELDVYVAKEEYDPSSLFAELTEKDRKIISGGFAFFALKDNGYVELPNNFAAEKEGEDPRVRELIDKVIARVKSLGEINAGSFVFAIEGEKGFCKVHVKKCISKEEEIAFEPSFKDFAKTYLGFVDFDDLDPDYELRYESPLIVIFDEGCFNDRNIRKIDISSSFPYYLTSKTFKDCPDLVEISIKGDPHYLAKGNTESLVYDNCPKLRVLELSDSVAIWSENEDKENLYGFGDAFFKEYKGVHYLAKEGNDFHYLADCPISVEELFIHPDCREIIVSFSQGPYLCERIYLGDYLSTHLNIVSEALIIPSELFLSSVNKGKETVDPHEPFEFIEGSDEEKLKQLNGVFPIIHFSHDDAPSLFKKGGYTFTESGVLIAVESEEEEIRIPSSIRYENHDVKIRAFLPDFRISCENIKKLIIEADMKEIPFESIAYIKAEEIIFPDSFERFIIAEEPSGNYFPSLYRLSLYVPIYETASEDEATDEIFDMLSLGRNCLISYRHPDYRKEEAIEVNGCIYKIIEGVYHDELHIHKTRLLEDGSLYVDMEGIRFSDDMIFFERGFLARGGKPRVGNMVLNLSGRVTLQDPFISDEGQIDNLYIENVETSCFFMKTRVVNLYLKSERLSPSCFRSVNGEQLVENVFLFDKESSSYRKCEAIEINTSFPLREGDYSGVAGDSIKKIHIANIGYKGTIPSSCLNGFKLIKELKIPEGCESIGASFTGMEALESLDLPLSLISLHPSAFSGAEKLTKVICPKPLKDHFDTYTIIEEIELEDGRVELRFENKFTFENLFERWNKDSN